MLVDLKALFAFVVRYQLNLCVGEALGRQVGQHLMAEQMRVQRLRNAGLRQETLSKCAHTRTGKNRGLRGHRLVILVHVSAKWTR